MAHRSLAFRRLVAGATVALLAAALAASAFSSGQPAAADEHEGGLTDAVGDMLGPSDEDEEEDDAEAAEGDEPEEIEPDDGGGGGEQAPAPEEPAQQQESGGEEPAGDQGGDPAGQGSDSSAPVPSGPQRAAGPGVRAGGAVPEGAESTFDTSFDAGAVAAAPEVFSDDVSGSTLEPVRRPNPLALVSLPRENGPMDTLAGTGVPTELLAGATALLVMVGAAHALHATRRLGGDPLADVEPSDTEG